jgi:hypothetical protein
LAINMDNSIYLSITWGYITGIGVGCGGSWGGLGGAGVGGWHRRASPNHYREIKKHLPLQESHDANAKLLPEP